MSDWNAEQYGKFERERTLPSVDLVRAISVENVESVLDVGNSTQILKNHFPNAKITGCDNSENMLSAARKNHPDLHFIKLDASEELCSFTGQFDIVFSNACIQWISCHERLLKNLMNLVKENGVLAVQVPAQSKLPLRKIVEKVAAGEKWSEKITVSAKSNLLSEEAYFDLLSELSSDFRMWETTYFHAMPSHRAIVEWYKGTGLRPYLETLSDSEKSAFEDDVLREVEQAYPVQKNGEIIFRFPRLFFVARK